MIEQFFTDYRNTAWAFFSSIGFIFIVIKIAFMAYRLIWDKARLDQRQEFQGGYFDVGEKRHDKYLDDHMKMLNMYVELKTAYLEHENKALNAEIARLKKG